MSQGASKDVRAGTAETVSERSGRRATFPGSEFFALLPRFQADPQMAADLTALGSNETDVVGPWIDGRQ